GGILQCGEGNALERSEEEARSRRAASRAALVPGQRDGWAVADRAYARGGVRTESRGRRPADAVCGPGSDAGGLRIERSGDELIPGMGSHGARAVLSVCGRYFAASVF